MTDLTLRDDLVQWLQHIASREQRPVDELVETLLNQYDPIVRSEQATEEEVRQVQLRIYDRARQYWQSADDPRQHLSDEDLDQQFWVIDHNGIPRLKEDQATVVLPPDPLSQMLEIMEADRTIQWRPAMHHSESTKDFLNSAYTDYLLSRLNSPNDADE